MTKISVIIPVYNTEKYLKRCLDSVINQTLEDIEIICVNDCSTDNSLEILNTYAQKDSRIKLIDLKEKQNAAIARNYGLDNAQSEYLGFVDSDDFIDLDFYDKLYNCALKTNADIIKGNLKGQSFTGEIRISPVNDAILQSNEKMAFFADWQSAIYKNKFIKSNDIRFPVECAKEQDVVFLFRSVVKAKTVEIVNDTFYNYIRRPNSLESDVLDNPKAISAIKSCDLTCECLNNTTLDEVSIKGYLLVYFRRLQRYIQLFYTNTSPEVRDKIIKSLIKYYNAAKYKKELDKYIEDANIEFLFKYAKTNNSNEIYKELDKCKSAQAFFLKMFVNKFRKNVKRSITIV